MRPLRLRVRNFIGLRNVDVSFEGKSLFVIQGPNGAGKSSLLEAIYFALFGKSLRHDSGYEGVVNRHSPDGRAVVNLVFTHHGKRWRVKREIDIVEGRGRRRGSVYLECLDTREMITSAREASARIKKLIGLTDETFKTTVLLPQGQITTFLELTATKRMRVLKELLSGNKLTRVVELLDSDLRELEGAKNAYSAQLSTIDIDALKKERESLSPELSRLEKDLEFLENRKKELRERIEELRKLERTLRDIELERQLLESKRRDREKALKRIAEIEDELRKLRGERERVVSSLRRSEEICDIEERKLERLEAMEARLIPLENRISSLREDEARLLRKISVLRSKLDECSRNIDAERRRYEELGKKEERLKEEFERKRERYFIVELRKNLKKGDICPLCGSTINELLEPSFEVKSEELSRLKKLHAKALKDFQEAGRKLSGLEKEKEEKERELSELSSELDGVRKALAEKEVELEALNESWRKLLGEEASSFSLFEEALRWQREKLRNLERERESLRQALERMKARESSLIEEKDRKRREIEEIEREIEEKERRISDFEKELGLSVKLSEVQSKLKALEDELAGVCDREADLKERAWKAKSRIDTIDKELKNHQALSGKLEELEREISVLGELKRCLWDSNFPKYLVSRYLFDAVEIANSYLLRLTKGRFSVKATEELELFILDEDLGGEEKGIKDLSGGEKVLVSLSLALGIAEVLAGGLEAFFIDEGFSPLDRENLGMVAHELLELDQTGKLVGIITHDPMFADYFPEKLLVRGGMVEWA